MSQIKKCLYINRENKVIMRNKTLESVAELTGVEKYKNLYINVASKNRCSDAKMYIDIDIVCLYVCTISIKDIESKYYYNFDKFADVTLNSYKKYIDNCLNSNSYISLIDIKLMQLSGESEEYIKKLEKHRQKVIDLREKRHRENKIKRQEKEEKYVIEKNKEVNNMITEAERKILNKEEVTNEEITIYKDKYDSHSTSLILYMMKLYNIKVPLKTQGWINNALYSLRYNDYNDGKWGYEYYNSSKNSTVFYKYLEQLVKKIEEKYKSVDGIVMLKQEF